MKFPFTYGLLTGLLIVLVYSCTLVPALTVVDGQTKLSSSETTWLKPFSNDGEEYARGLMKARGYIYEPRKDNFWLDLTLGIGIALGGVMIAAGIILAVFSKGIYLKEGFGSFAAGVIMVGTFYFLMEYMKALLLCIAIGSGLLLIAGIWYVLHNREAIFRMVKTTEAAKQVHPANTTTNATKTTFRTIQGPFQKKLKRYHDLATNV